MPLKILKQIGRKLGYLNLNLRKFSRGIKNLITFTPIVYNLRPWDYEYTLILMREQLRRTLTCLENDIYTTKSKTKSLKICVLLLDRIIEDTYTGDCWYEMPYPKSRLEILFNGDRVSTFDDKYTKLTKHKFKRITLQENQDWDLLFKLMRKHMRGWWT